MLITIDPAAPMPLADQVSASVRAALARGDIKPGDRLPAARELASALGINLHTVLRGYRQLSDEGLVSLRRGRGAVVSEAASQHAALVDLARDFVAAARRLGATSDEIVDTVRVTLDRA
ncbi:GntR family transcriptional regulator [Longimycelium tulufanense]|uniref:GntR family transcriptional regulator n=1 Tax=Longimycelium tulufanense TaxID=907463 RepID=A0A8J3FUP3_9PSEU|nr:GntR family transcriptional regulator [Longimycelium tulufanense]GGM51952.1 GntR family transcriptional regulator [Longimycelium tulufanense]